MPTRVIQVEDLVGSIMEEKDTKEYLEEAKSSIGICGEELEKQIEEHTLINKGYERES
jgi:predicted  nucleic acid-binding Zn ribbon protein